MLSWYLADIEYSSCSCSFPESVSFFNGLSHCSSGLARLLWSIVIGGQNGLTLDYYFGLDRRRSRFHSFSVFQPDR